MVLSAALIAATISRSSAIEVDIATANGSPTELAAVRQLKEILSAYDLSRWIVVKYVLIEDDVIPHSHPRLTLNTQYLDDSSQQLATFIHEQLHWHLSRDRSALKAAIEDIEHTFPGAPSNLPDGAQGKESTHLHILLCYLEYAALRDLVGEKEAQRIILSFPYYRWIYRTVIDSEDLILSVLIDHSVRIP